jgi:tripartite-type tricarboxylate transporter receptor subunit TctC
MRIGLGNVSVVLVLSLHLILPSLAAAQENFYQGKTIGMIVGTSVGGGFDAHTRMIGEYSESQITLLAHDLCIV